MAIYPAPLSVDERQVHYLDMRDMLNSAQEEILRLVDPIKGIRQHDQREQVLSVYDLLETALSRASSAFGPVRRES